VGATKPLTPSRTGDLMASYSSKGPTALDHIAKPDVVAPGNMLVSLEAPNSTLYDGYPGNRVPYSFYVTGGSSADSSSYFTLSGTSMATGLVSGVVADLLQKSPKLKPDQVKARLMKTAWKSLPVFSSIFVPTAETTYTDQDDVFTVGAGYVDVEAALADADVATETAMSPTANYDRKTGNVYLTPSASAVWNTSPEWNFRTVWGTSQFVHSNSAMWGSYAVWGNSAIWGNSAMWKNSGMWGNNDAWGSDTIWSDSAMWGSSIEAGEPN
jgi:serine protease AprX